MLTGLASSLWSRTEPVPEHEQQPDVFAGEYLAERLQEIAPDLMHDDILHKRRCLTAAVALATALDAQRRRFTRAPDDTRHLLDALAVFVAGNDGTALAASRERYTALVDAWNSVAHARRDGRSPTRPRPAVAASAPCGDAAAAVIHAWRHALAERLGHVPGICMTGAYMRSADVTDRAYAALRAANDAETAVGAAFDIEYSISGSAGVDDDDESGLVHARTAKQGLAPLVAAVRALGAEHDPARVRLDWTLCVEAVAHTDDTSDSDASDAEVVCSRVHIHCSVGYAAYVVDDTA